MLKTWKVLLDDGTADGLVHGVPARMFGDKYCNVDVYGHQAVIQRVQKHTRLGKKFPVRAIKFPGEDEWTTQF